MSGQPDSDWGCFRGCAISSSVSAPFFVYHISSHKNVQLMHKLIHCIKYASFFADKINEVNIFSIISKYIKIQMISRVAYTIKNTLFRRGRLRFVVLPWHSGTMASPRLRSTKEGGHWNSNYIDCWMCLRHCIILFHIQALLLAVLCSTAEAYIKG